MESLVLHEGFLISTIVYSAGGADSACISSCNFAATILHCAATFLAAILNACALGDSESVIITGLPESEPSIIPELSGISPRNGILCFSLIFCAPPFPNM